MFTIEIPDMVEEAVSKAQIPHKEREQAYWERLQNLLLDAASKRMKEIENIINIQDFKFLTPAHKQDEISRLKNWQKKQTSYLLFGSHGEYRQEFMQHGYVSGMGLSAADRAMGITRLQKFLDFLMVLEVADFDCWRSPAHWLPPEIEAQVLVLQTGPGYPAYTDQILLSELIEKNRLGELRCRHYHKSHGEIVPELYIVGRFHPTKVISIVFSEIQGLLHWRPGWFKASLTPEQKANLVNVYPRHPMVV